MEANSSYSSSSTTSTTSVTEIRQEKYLNVNDRREEDQGVMNRYDSKRREPVLDLSLPRSDEISPELLTFNVISPETRKTEKEPRVFSCTYCDRKFLSSQALGGHQNAHKRERTLAKRHLQHQHHHDRSTTDGSVYDHQHRYPSLSCLPTIYGSFSGGRSVGFQLHGTQTSYPSGIVSNYGHAMPQMMIGRTNVADAEKIGNYHRLTDGYSKIKGEEEELGKLDLTLKL